MAARIQRKSVALSSRNSRLSVIVTSDDTYSYALRTAYLHHLLQPRPRRQVPVPAAPARPQRSSTSNIHELMKDFSVSLSHRDSKGTRLPKDFLPVLQKRLEAVWMGRDSHVEYKDATVKRTFAAFYTAFKEPRYYESVAKSRRTEDLVLIFYSSATKELQRVIQDDSYKWKVDRHVALFVRLMHTCLSEHGWMSSYPDLATRFSTLESKLLQHDENLAEESGASSAAKGGATVLGPPEPASNDVNDMVMVKIVSKVFSTPLEICQQDIDRNKLVWTERAALQDLKAYSNNLNLNTKRTLRRDDFSLEEAYDAWRKSETPQLSKLMLAIMQSNPAELAKTTSTVAPISRRPGHAHSVSYQVPGRNDAKRTSMLSTSEAHSLYGVEEATDVDVMGLSNGSSVEDDDTPYVYIPPDPRTYYRQLLENCIKTDMNDPEIVPVDVPGADGPMHLLSKQTKVLLDECCLRWRLPEFSRMILFLEVIHSKYREEQINLQTLDGAFIYFKNEVGSDWPYWTLADQIQYKQTLAGVHDFVVRELYDILQTAYNTKAIPAGRVLWILDQHLYNDPQFTVDSMETYVDQLKQGLKTRAQEVLQEMLAELPGDRTALDPLHLVEMTQGIIKLAEKVSKRFKEPILNSVDPMMIFVEVAFPKYAMEAKNLVLELIATYKERGAEVDMEDGFDLYRELSEIRRIYSEAFPNKKFPVRLEDFLSEFVYRWVQSIDAKVIGWVDGAIKEDDFALRIREEQGREPLDEERHTSSVVDIFRSFNQPVDFLKKLDWADDYSYAKFMTALAKILGKGISRYCEVLETLFTHEMDRPTAEQEALHTLTRQQKWVAMAKEAWSNKDKIEPFQFAPASCVKLNNIEFATQQFDRLESSADVDALAAVMVRHTPPNPTRKKNTYVFTIKIVEAEDLKAMDIGGYSDPYVVLGDEFQKRLAKTRIVYANLNPRWEESFDITTQGPIWLTATVWDWDTVGDHDCLGRTSIKLDPSHFMDFLPKEFWLDLDIQGRILLRISMEGETDDIQFHFGKAFRTLKRTERDMTRQITDKLSAYIHHCLSKAALKNVISKGYSMSTVSNLFSRTGFNTRPASGSTPGTITEADVASAISPLTDYFNENFAILNMTLTSSAMTLVMAKLWKEVLVTLEGLLVPTLSDKPSQQRQLTQQETEVVFKWLQLMFDFFHAVDETGEASGVPIDILKSPKYHELQSLNFFYFESTDNLIRTSERMANAAAARQQAARQKMMGVNTSSSGMLGVPGMTKRTKSVMMSRNMKTMRKAKEEKRREAQADPNDDMILRILRMRPEAAGYLRDRSRQKERLEASAAAEAIVRQSMNTNQNRMMANRR